MNPDYIRTVQLLLEVAPAVFESPVFAMKGGTALNLFLQDIGDELAAAQARLEARGFEALLRKSKDGHEAKLFVSSQDTQVKVEVNFVFRGTVLPPERRSLVPSAQQRFSANIDVPVLAPPELYGSKLVAALDPRCSATSSAA